MYESEQPEGIILVSKDKKKRVITGDIYALFQAVRRKQCLQMIENKSAMDWFGEMERTYPDIEVFSFDKNDKVSRAPSTADKGSEGSLQVVEVVIP